MDGTAPSVGIIMGSRSDWETMRHAAEALDRLGIAHERRVVSAHRTPARLVAYAQGARGRGLKVIIAGAGGAAHLPGMVASMTPLPVLGVPVGTLAIGKAGAINAALLAASILALGDPRIAAALDEWRRAQTDAVPERPDSA
jgi:5-(carboxyamino)imidazole ribonucleotide mutase